MNNTSPIYFSAGNAFELSTLNTLATRIAAQWLLSQPAVQRWLTKTSYNLIGLFLGYIHHARHLTDVRLELVLDPRDKKAIMIEIAVHADLVTGVSPENYAAHLCAIATEALEQLSLYQGIPAVEMQEVRQSLPEAIGQSPFIIGKTKWPRRTPRPEIVITLPLQGRWASDLAWVEQLEGDLADALERKGAGEVVDQSVSVGEVTFVVEGRLAPSMLKAVEDALSKRSVLDIARIEVHDPPSPARRKGNV